MTAVLFVQAERCTSKHDETPPGLDALGLQQYPIQNERSSRARTGSEPHDLTFPLAPIRFECRRIPRVADGLRASESNMVGREIAQSTPSPSVEVCVQYHAVGDLEEALSEIGLSAYFIVWRLLMELDAAGAPYGVTNHDFEIWRGTEQFHFVGSYSVEKNVPDIRFKISLVRGEADDLVSVTMSDDLRRRLWPTPS
jgi:hypothetical protein